MKRENEEILIMKNVSKQFHFAIRRLNNLNSFNENIPKGYLLNFNTKEGCLMFSRQINLCLRNLNNLYRELLLEEYFENTVKKQFYFRDTYSKSTYHRLKKEACRAFLEEFKKYENFKCFTY